MWDLPGPGIEPVSPALAGGFFTTKPSGKPGLHYLFIHINSSGGFPDGSVVKNLPANAEDLGLIPGVKKIPWRRKWQPTPVFLSGNSIGQRSCLVGYSP